ncbi:MAG: LPS export ABC transporter periplasmic protein LptC [Chitinophagaceae bacterium]|nr:LPS export ABC transporter periplasmic protein LptC [Chitinophagaceae bacterium]
MINVLTRQRVAYLAVLLVSFLVVGSCENDVKQVDELFRQKITVEDFKGVTTYMSQSGKMKAKLTAPIMTRFQADTPYVEFPQSLHVDFYNDSSVIESIVDAEYARYNESESKVFLRDSVEVVNILKGDTLRTDELWWDQNTQEFYTDKPVRIYQPDKTIYGKGLKAAQNFSWYNIFNITGVVLTSGDGILQ